MKFLIFICIVVATNFIIHPSPTNNVALKPGRTVTFALPSDPLLSSAGVIQDSRYGSLFYFSELQTKKQVTFCDSTGRMIAAVPLAKAQSAMIDINSVAAISRDSIIALSIVNNSVALINGRGEMVSNNHLALKWGTTDYLLDAYAATAPGPSGRLYAKLMPNPMPFTVNDDPKTLDNESYCTTGTGGPALVEISHAGTLSVSTEMLLQGIRQRAVPGLRYKDNFATVYDHDDHSAFYASAFGDSIYRVDLKSNRVMNATRLEAANVRFGIKAPNSIPELGAVMKNYFFEPVFPALTYDRYRKLVYLSVYHEVPATSPSAETGHHRRWTLLVFDDKLKKLTELGFERDTYEPASLIVSPEGLWLKKIISNDGTSKPQYQLFRVS